MSDPITFLLEYMNASERVDAQRVARTVNVDELITLVTKCDKVAYGRECDKECPARQTIEIVCANEYGYEVYNDFAVC